MPLRFAITKATGQGEQFVIDICQWNPVTGDIVHLDINDMSKELDEAFRFADTRLLEMNTRMLEAYHFEEYFDTATWQKVVAILDILAGRQTAAIVRQRWDATQEENEALAKQREAAFVQFQLDNKSY